MHEDGNNVSGSLSFEGGENEINRVGVRSFTRTFLCCLRYGGLIVERLSFEVAYRPVATKVGVSPRYLLILHIAAPLLPLACILY